jgi:hypothetical protein
MSGFEWIDVPAPGTVQAAPPLPMPKKFEWLGVDDGTGTRAPESDPVLSRPVSPPAGVSGGMLFRVPGNPNWYYFTKSGDTLGLSNGIADRGIGERSRFMDIVRSNPQKPRSTAADCAANSGTCPPGQFKTLFANEVLIWPETWPVDRIQSVDLFGSGGTSGKTTKASMVGPVVLAVALLGALALAVAGRG